MASIDCQETSTTKFTKRGGNQAETSMDLHTQKTMIYVYVYTHPHTHQERKSSEIGICMIRY